MNKLDSIKKACKITDKVYSNVLKNFSKFHSEKDIERFIRNEFKKLRVKPAFPPIVSMGINSWVILPAVGNLNTNSWFSDF